MKRVVLSAALAPNPLTTPLLTGAVQPEGICLIASALHGSEMFWRQLAFAEFDVSEMSLASLIVATAQGPTPWVAVPVFTTRRFFHTGILVREDAGIEHPRDLRGKRVGVPEYQQTSAVWSRGILKDRFDVDPRDIVWYMERSPERSHGGVTGFVAPAGIDLRRIESTTNIGEMLVAGELDATLLYLNAANLIDRSRADLSRRTDVRYLFRDRGAEARSYYASSGIYPINHTLVVRRSLLARDTWIAQSIYRAFVDVKARLRAERDAVLEPYFATGMLDAGAGLALRADPLAYGLSTARPALETILRYTFEQGLTHRRVAVEELFEPSCMLD